MNTTRELTLTTHDLSAVGITSQLTSNDLLEVVANDIYEKFMSEVHDCVKAEMALKKKAQEIMQPEYDQIKSVLVKAKHLQEGDHPSFSYSKIDGNDWSSGIYGLGLDITEKDKGTRVQKDTDAITFYYPRGTEANVMVTVSVQDREDKAKSEFSGIKCETETITNKKFTKVIKLKTDRWKTLLEEIKVHNKRIESLCELLPANGVLSVERFSREARIKMNKKIISAQSPDFRKKISELFNIKL